VQGGAFFIFNPPASEDTEPPISDPPISKRPFSPGQSAMVELGFDIGDRLSLGVFALAAMNRAGSEYTGNSGGTASGDFSTLALGATARVNVASVKDSQEVRRLFVYARAGAGLAMFSPKLLLPDSDILVFVGPGVEYYTRLRHFSVGLEVTGSYLISSGSIGFAVTPNLRYAF
jgi:hypothetical protein